MKKALLGVLALTSVASFADVTGYVKSNSEAKAETDVKKEESRVKFEGQKFPVKTKLDLGFFLDSNKDTFLFTGAKLSGEAQKEGVVREGYAGARFDSMLTENTSLILNAVAGYTGSEKGFDKKEKSIENALKEHLDAKKVWSADKKAELERKDKEDDRNNFYKDNGFRLTENDRLLLSAVVKNNTETSSLLAGTIYNLDKDVYSRLESFVKAGKQLDGFRLDAELTHVLGKDKEFSLKDGYSYNLLEETEAKNLEYAGRIKGNVKVSTKLLNDTLELSAKPSFDLDSVFDKSGYENIESERYFKTGIENVAKYTGLKNTTIEGKLVYNAEGYTAPIKENEKIETKDEEDQVVEVTTGNAGALVHLPKAVLNIKYDDGRFLAETKNETEFYARTILGETKDKDNNSLKKTTFDGVKFETKNKLAYKLTNNLGLNGVAEYKLEKEIEGDSTHSVLAGAGLSYAKDSVKAELNGRYILSGILDTEKVFDSSYEIFANSKLSTLVKNGGLTLTPSLSTFVNVNSGKQVLFAVKPELKTVYSINSFELINELGFKYLLSHSEDGNNKSNDSAYAGRANFGINYLINENHKLGLALDSDYSYKLNNSLFDSYETGIDKLMNNFDGEKSKDIYSYLGEDKRTKGINDETKEMVKYDHRFNLTPKVNAVLKFGNVTVKPEVLVKFKFGKDAKDFSLRKIDGKGTLNIEYRW